MSNLIEINSKTDILSQYQNTPIGLLLEYHNLNKQKDQYDSADLLVGMCMDHRKRLNIPEKFAYIIRTGGGNLRNNEFQVSYAIGVGGIKHIALIGHTDCGMVNLIDRKESFVEGLVNIAGWQKGKAEDQFNQFAPIFEVGNAVDFTLNEAKRLRLKYPKVIIAPMLYKVEDNKLYLIEG